MKKEEFLNELRKKLSGLPEADVEDRISFYSEAIADRMDEGKSEEEAVADLGSVDEVVNEIAKDTPLIKLVKEKVKPKRSLSGWEIVLIVLGFPLWFPLLLTFFILCLIPIIILWALVLGLYAAEGGLIGYSIVGLVAFFSYLSEGTMYLVPLGASIMSLGGAMLIIFACIGATKGTAILTKNFFLAIKSSIIKKGNK